MFARCRGSMQILEMIVIAIFAVSAARAQNTGTTVINNEQWIDGVALSNPQQIYSSSFYDWQNTGGVIHWINTRPAPPFLTAPVVVNGNAFGNTTVYPQPLVSLVGGSCSGHLPVSQPITIEILPFDNLGDLDSSLALNTTSPSGTTNCLTVTLPTTGFPGFSFFQVAACSGVGCAPYILPEVSTVLVKPATFGPFQASTNSFTFDWSTVGPIPPPQNSVGLVVPNTIIDFGTGPFLISVPQVPGTASGIAGYKRNISTIQLSPSFPNGVPQLSEPWGQLCSSSTCTQGVNLNQSVTADVVLYDSGSGSNNPVQVSEPHTFPAFQTGFEGVQINNPGVPLASGVWAPSTYYWAGERAAVNVTGSQWIVLNATTAGTSSTTQPNWQQVSSGGVCSSIAAGGTCQDGSVLVWTILSVINAYSTSSTYVLGSEVYAPSTGTFWESQQNITTPGTWTPLAGSPIGLVVADANSNNWINIGLNTLVSPLFAFWTNSCPTSAGNYTKQCAGDGTSAHPYLSQLKLWASPSASWSGCTKTAVCIQGTFTLVSTYTAVTGVGTMSGTFPATPTPTASTACPSWWTGCTGLTGEFFVEAVWFTPSGGASPMGESATTTSCTTSTCKVLQISAPSNPPPNAVGWMPFVSITSGNDLQGKPNGVQGYCLIGSTPTYVTNLPYGTLCPIGATFILTSLTSSAGPQRPTATNASEIAVGLAGLPITGRWPGGAYASSINDVTIECSKQNLVPSVIEPYAWGVFNMSAQEMSNQNGAGHGGIETVDCAGGGYYLFGPGAEDAGAGAFHVNTGQVADYTYGVRVEDVGAFREVMDVSIGPAAGSQYATRAGVQFKVNLVSTIPQDSQCGQMVDMHGEDTIEQMDVSNCAFRAANIYGRTGNAGRSPAYGLHIEPFTADYNADQIVALGNGCNIQDDTIDPAGPCLSSAQNYTSGFFAVGDVTGSSSQYATLLTTDPMLPSQFFDGAKHLMATPRARSLKSGGKISGE